MPDKTCGECPHYSRMEEPMFFGEVERDGLCEWAVGPTQGFVLSTSIQYPARTSERKLLEVVREAHHQLTMEEVVKEPDERKDELFALITKIEELEV